MAASFVNFPVMPKASPSLNVPKFLPNIGLTDLEHALLSSPEISSMSLIGPPEDPLNPPATKVVFSWNF